MFGFGKKDENKELREKSIRELKKAYPFLRQIKKSDLEYELLFSISGQYQILKIQLSHQFPSVPPGFSFSSHLFQIIVLNSIFTVRITFGNSKWLFYKSSMD